MGRKNIYTGLLINMVSIPTFLLAQVSIQQGIVALEGTTSQVSINTALTNRGDLIHQGNLALEEDLYNEGSYQATEGTLILQGKDQEVFSGTLTLKGLQITNGFTKTLTGTFEIQNHLTLENGLLSIPDDSKLIVSDQASVLKSSTESYVQGFLYHQGKGEKFFPIGNTNEYAPVTLHNIQGEAPVVGVKYHLTSHQPYWQQHVLDGTYQGSTVTLTFQSHDADFHFYQDQLEVLGTYGHDQSPAYFGNSFLNVNSSEFTISSRETTAMPWLTVGFALDKSSERVYVPNAFSPEASNPEDQRIRVYGALISLQNFQFGIQDAWGRWVYQTSSLEEAMTKGWPETAFVSSQSWYRYVLSGKFLSGSAFQRSDVIMKF